MSSESRVQWLSHASNAVDGTRFRDAGFEARYRLQMLEEDRRAAILCCAVVGLAFLAFIPNDWRLHGASATFWALLALHVAHTAVCAMTLWQLHRAATPGRLDLLVHVWTAATVCAVLLVTATRAAGNVGVLISHLPLLLLFYISLPLGHRERLLYAWAYSIGFVTIRLVVAQETDVTALTALAIGTLAIHTFGPVASARGHHMGRQLAAATWEVEDLRKAAYTAAGLSEYRYDLDSDTRLHGPPAPEAFGPVPPLTFDAVLDMVHPDDRPAVVASYAGARNFGADLAVEFRLGRGNDHRWLRSVGIVVGRDRGTRGQLVGLTWDITSRKVAELRAEDLGKRLHLAVDAARLNPFSVDLRSGQHLPGPRDIELFGAPLTSLEQFESMVLPQDRPLVARLRDDDEFADGRVVAVEYRIRHPSGELRWIACSALRLNDAHGRPLQLVGVSYDISAHRRDELALAESRKQLERALRNGRMALWTWTRRDGLLTPYGGVATELFGRTAGQLEEYLELVRTEDRQRLVDRWREATLGGDDFVDEFRLRPVAGVVRWVRVQGKAERHPLQGYLTMAGVLIDVTEQKQYELLLQQSQRWKDLAVEGAALNLWEVNVSTRERRGGALDEHFFGCSPVAFGDFDRLVHPDDFAAFDAARQACISDGALFDCEYRIRRPDGEVRWLSSRGRRFLEDGDGQIRVVGVTTDATARKQVELELRAALQLAHQASEAKSAFLATMSHEIRTPLNAVVGFSGLLLDSDLDETQRFHARLLRTSSQQLLALIDNVLDFSRIEAGEMPLEQVGFVPEECLESCLDLVATQAEAKGLCLTLSVHGSGRRAVRGDLTRVRQIAVNLLSNAIKFTDRGAVRCELIVSERDAVAWLGLRVTDSGIGMTEEVRASLFQPFRQGDASTTRRYGGTGLGLSICLRLARLMGGEIEATSSPGEGSEFVLALPVAWLDAADAAPTASATVGLNVAVAVYPPALQAALTSQLDDFGTRHTVVEPAALAVHLAAGSGRYDALLVDDSLQALCDTGSDWPRARNGGPLPAVVLTPLRHDRVMSIGAHGERRLPLSRVLKPSELRGALTDLGQAPAHADSRGEKSGPTPAFAQRAWRVLVAEDNSVNRILLQLQLEALGYQADTVTSGAQALDALRAPVHDIVLMDIEMPEMDGMEATRLIRAACAGTRGSPYVIAVTAHVMADSRARFLDAGMDDYVSKPVMVDALREALERANRGLQERRAP